MNSNNIKKVLKVISEHENVLYKYIVCLRAYLSQCSPNALSTICYVTMWFNSSQFSPNILSKLPSDYQNGKYR